MGARRCSGPWLVTLLALATMSCGDRSDDAEIGSAPADAARPPRPAGSASAVAPGIPEYQPAGGVSGNLTSVGSDSLNNLMTLWAEEFRRRHPNVRIQIEGKGSSTAPPALIEGTAQVGPMSRPMKPSETDAFEKRFGYRPTEVRVAVDALALYVHRDNPLERLTFPQVDAIFSRTRACGGSHELARWGDLQVEGPLAHRQISLYGRNSASGTYGYFKEHALCGGDFKDTLKEQPGSASVVSSISEDPAGIGYSGIGYRTSGVKAVALAETEDGPFHPTTSEAVLAGRYPLARHLFLYVNRPPERPLDPLVLEFLRFVLSRSGQQVVLKDGYLPLPAGDVAAERTELE